MSKFDWEKVHEKHKNDYLGKQKKKYSFPDLDALFEKYPTKFMLIWILLIGMSAGLGGFLGYLLE